MAPRRFVLILATVIAAAGLTVWVATWAESGVVPPVAGIVAVPLLLLAAIGVRVIAARRGRKRP